MSDAEASDAMVALRIVKKIAGGPYDGKYWDAWYIDVSVDLDAEELALLDRLHESGGQQEPEPTGEPCYQGDPNPLCPHGCYKRKPMTWAEDQWFCPKCKSEFVADAPFDRVGSSDG